MARIVGARELVLLLALAVVGSFALQYSMKAGFTEFIEVFGQDPVTRSPKVSAELTYPTTTTSYVNNRWKSPLLLDDRFTIAVWIYVQANVGSTMQGVFCRELAFNSNDGGCGRYVRGVRIGVKNNQVVLGVSAAITKTVQNPSNSPAADHETASATITIGEWTPVIVSRVEARKFYLVVKNVVTVVDLPGTFPETLDTLTTPPSSCGSGGTINAMNIGALHYEDKELFYGFLSEVGIWIGTGINYMQLEQYVAAQQLPLDIFRTLDQYMLVPYLQVFGTIEYTWADQGRVADVAIPSPRPTPLALQFTQPQTPRETNPVLALQAPMYTATETNTNLFSTTQLSPAYALWFRTDTMQLSNTGRPIDEASPFTLAMEFRADIVSEATGAPAVDVKFQSGYLFSFSKGGFGVAAYYQAEAASRIHRVKVYLRHSTLADECWYAPLSANERTWQQLSFSYGGPGGQHRLHLDEQVVEGKHSPTADCTNQPATTDHFTIGGPHPVDANFGIRERYFTGFISQVIWLDRALDADMQRMLGFTEWGQAAVDARFALDFLRSSTASPPGCAPCSTLPIRFGPDGMAVTIYGPNAVPMQVVSLTNIDANNDVGQPPAGSQNGIDQRPVHYRTLMPKTHPSTLDMTARACVASTVNSFTWCTGTCGTTTVRASLKMLHFTTAADCNGAKTSNDTVQVASITALGGNVVLNTPTPNTAVTFRLCASMDGGMTWQMANGKSWEVSEVVSVKSGFGTVTAGAAGTTKPTAVAVLRDGNTAAINVACKHNITVDFGQAGGVATLEVQSTNTNEFTLQAPTQVNGAGTFDIKLYIDGVDVATTQVAINAGEPNAASTQCSSGTLCAATPVASTSQTIQFTLFDAFGNQLTNNASVGVAAVMKRTGNADIVIPLAHATNVFTASGVSVTQRGAYTVHARLGSTTSGSLRTTTVQSGPLSASHSIVSVTTATTLTVGSQMSVTVVKRDQFGNAEPSGACSPSALISFPAGNQIITSGPCVAPIGQETSSTTYHVAQVVRFNATIGGVHVSGSPYTAGVTFVPGSPIAARSTVTSNNFPITAGSLAEVQVQLKDTYENLISPSAAQRDLTTVTININDQNVDFTVRDVVDTKVRLRLNITRAGQYSAAVRYNGGDIGTLGALRVDAGVASASNFVVGNTGTSQVGVPITFPLHTRDRFNNPLASSTGLALTGNIGSAQLQFEAVSADTVQYNYTVTQGAATYQLYIKLDGQDVNGIPLSVVVSQGVTSAARSHLVVAGNLEVVAGQTLLLRLQARDAYGNVQVLGGENGFQAKVRLLGMDYNDAAAVGLTLTDLNNGQYDVRVATTKAGMSNVTVRLNGDDVDSATVMVKPASFGPSNTQVSAADSLVAGNTWTVNVTARDIYGNQMTDNGVQFNFVWTLHPVGVPEPPAVQFQAVSGGLYTATTVALTKTGSYQMKTQTGGVSVPAPTSTKTVTVGSASIDASKSTLSVNNGVASNGVSGTYSLTLRDAFNNEVTQAQASDLAVTFLGTPTKSAGLNGMFTGTYTSTVATEHAYSVRVGAGGPHISPSPSTVRVNPAAASVGAFTLHGVVNMTAGELREASLQYRDQYGNNRSTYDPGQPTVTVQDGDGSQVTGGNLAVVDGTAGVKLIRFRATKRGTVTVTVNVGGTAIQGGPQQASVLPAAERVNECTLSGTLSVLAGAGTTLTVQSRDEFGNARTDVPSVFTAQAVHSSAGVQLVVNSTVSASSLGQSVLMLNATLSGGYTMHVRSNGVDIKGSPMTLTISPAAPVQAQFVTFGTGVSGVLAGQAWSFSIRARDAFGNNRTENTESIAATATLNLLGGGQVTRVLNTFSVASGEYAVTMHTATVAGTYSLAVLAQQVGTSPQHVAGSPFAPVVRPEATNVSRSLVFGPGTAETTAGIASTVYVQARDKFDNNRTSNEETLVVTFGKASTTHTVVQSSQGLYVVEYNATERGLQTLQVRFGVDLVPDATPRQFNVRSGPTLVSKSVLTGGALENGVAGSAEVFQVQLFDAYGNARDVGMDAVSAQAVGTGGHGIGSTVVAACTVANSNQGIHACTYNATLSGTYLLTVSVNGATAPTTPRTLTISPGVVNAFQSVLRNTSNNVADVANTFVVQLRDAFGNNVTRAQAGVSQSVVGKLAADGAGTPVFVGMATTTPSDSELAVYTVAVHATTSGRYRVSASVNNATLGNVGMDAGTVDVFPGAVARSSSIFASLSASVDAGSLLQVTVMSRDQYGNNQTSDPGVGLSVRLEHTAQASAVQTTVLTYGGAGVGTYQGAVNVTLSGDYRVGVSSGSALVGEVRVVTIRPAALSVVHSTVSGQGVSQQPLGTDARVVVSARDVFSNVRSLSTDTFTVLVNRVGGPSVNVTNAGTVSAGEYLFTYVFGALTNHNVTVLHGASQLPGSPFTAQPLANANLTSISPDKGRTTGGALVTLTGTGFVQIPEMKVIVNGLACTGVTVLSGTQLYCSAPALPLGSGYTVNVTNNDGSYSVTEILYSTYPPETASAFSPSSGRTFGKEKVTVTGSNFLNTATLGCAFGNNKSPTVTFVSANEVVCEAPPMDAGKYTVGVGNNGQQYARVSSNTLYTVVEPFSPLCRETGELEVGVQERTSLGAVYFPNLALNATLNGTAAGQQDGISNTSTSLGSLIDGDRCCLKTDATGGFRCGRKFDALASSATALTAVQVNLAKPAFVNEFVTTWYQPCRNQPPFYFVDYWDESTLQWTQLVTRVTKVEGVSLGAQKPCFFVPSDQNDASICLDFLASEVRAQQFRIRFNNSEALMGAVGSSVSDGAWMYEVEVHGIATDEPTQVRAVGTYGAVDGLGATATFPLPSVVAETLNHKAEVLLSNDTQTQSFQVRLFRDGLGGGQVQLASGAVAGTLLRTAQGGRANFSDLALLFPVADTYRIQFDTIPSTNATWLSLRVSVGVAYRLDRTSSASVSMQSTLNSSIPAVSLRVLDVSGNVLSAPGVNVSVEVVGGNSQSLSLHGRVWANATGPLLTFNEVYSLSPRKGDYVLKFNSSGILGTSVALTVTEGVAYSLEVTNALSASVQSATTMALGSLSVRTVDSAGVATALGPAANTMLSVRSLNSSVALSGSTTVALKDGVAQVNDLSLSLAKVGRYVFSVGAGAGIAFNTSVSVEVRVGTATQLVLASTSNVTLACSSSTTVDNVDVRTADLLGQYLGSADSSTLAVGVTQQSGPVSALKTVKAEPLSSGRAVFASFSLGSPRVGTYVLQMLLPGLQAVTLTVVVVPGAGASLRVDKPASGVLNAESAVAFALGEVQVTSLDVGGNVVGTADNETRTTTAALTTQSSSLRSNGSSTSMVAGTATFNNLAVLRLPQGEYTLRISAVGIALGVEVTVNSTTGIPYGLTSSVVSTTVTSASVANIGQVEVRVVDANGQTVDAHRVVNRTVSVGGSNDTSLQLQGGLSVVLNGSTAVALFDSVQLVLPRTGVYSLEFTSEGLLNGSAALVVRAGAAVRVRRVGDGALVVRTASTVNVPTLSYEVLDVSGNVASGTVVDVQLSASGSLVLHGSVVSSSSGGTGSFGAITLVRPAVANYTLEIGGVGLQNASVVLAVQLGLGYRLSANSSVSGIASDENSAVGVLVVHVRDAADNVVPVELADTRTVSVRQVGGPSNMALSGTLSASLLNASTASFGNVSLVRPLAGQYTLEVSSAGLLATNVSVEVVRGAGKRLVIVSPSGSVAVSSAVDVALPTYTVRVLDSGGNFVGDTDVVNRSVVVASDAPLVGTLGLSSVAGEVQFSNLRLARPQNGTYQVWFQSGGLQNVSGSIVVSVGAAQQLSVSPSSAGVYRSSEIVNVSAVVVRVLDAGGTQSGVSGEQLVSASVNDSRSGVVPSGLASRLTQQSASVYSVQMQRPKVGAYAVVFESNGLVSTRTSVEIVVGEARALYARNSSNIGLGAVVNTELPGILLGLLDAGGNGPVDDDTAVRSVEGRILNASATTTGLGAANAQIMRNGSLVFACGVLVRPAAGVYVLEVSSAGLGSGQTSFQVVVGPNHQLRVVEGGVQQVASSAASVLAPVRVVVEDAGGSVTSTGVGTVAVAGPAGLVVSRQGGGSLSYSMNGGQATAIGVQVEGGRVGTYALSVSSGSLAGATVQVQVTAGAATGIVATVQGQPNVTIASSSVVDVSAMRVVVVDAGGNEVGALDTAGTRTLRVESSSVKVASGSQTHTLAQGAGEFNVTLEAPVQGQHVLVISSTGLASSSLVVVVTQGVAVSLSVPGASELASSAVAVDTAVPVLTVRATDAGGNTTTLSGVRNVSVRLASASSAFASLNGSTTQSMMNGVVSFGGLTLFRPAVLSEGYELVLSSVGLIPQRVRVYVKTGLAFSLVRAVAERTSSNGYAVNAEVVPLRRYTVVSADAGGNVVTDGPSVAGVLVNATLVSAGSELVGGMTRVALVNGTTAVFDSLALRAGLVGVYTLQFAANGLEPMQESVRFFVGQPARVRAEFLFTSSVDKTKASVLTSDQSYLPEVLGVLLDSGGNEVTTAPDRTVTVAVASSTGGVNSNGQVVAIAELSGQQSKLMQQGRVRFGGLALNRPQVGVHVLAVGFVGSSVLEGRMEVTVSAGVPRSLVLTHAGASAFVSVPFGGDVSAGTHVPTLELGMQDVALNRVNQTRSDPVVVRPVRATGSSSPLDTAFVSGGQASMTNGRAVLNALYVTAMTGNHVFSVTLKDVGQVELQIQVLAGPVVEARLHRGIEARNNNTGVIAQPPQLYLYDSASNFANKTGEVFSFVVQPNVFSAGGEVAVSKSGVVTFDELTFTGVYGERYTYTFTATRVAVSTSGINGTFEIVQCAERTANTERDGTGRFCVCAKGFNGEQLPCVACEAGKYKDEVGNDACSRCPLNEDTGGLVGAVLRSQCSCISTFYRNTTSGGCAKCPAGTSCVQGQEVQPLPGNFRFVPGSPNSYPCPNPAACKGGVNSTCAAGYTGPLCTVCADTYGKFGSSCLECPEAEVNWLLVVLFFLVLLFGLGGLVRTATGKRSAVSIIMKIMLNYLQVTAFIGQFRLDWSDDLVRFYEATSLSLFSLNIQPMDCTMRLSYYDQVSAYMVLPWLVLVLPVFGYLVAYVVITEVMPRMGVDIGKPTLEDESVMTEAQVQRRAKRLARRLGAEFGVEHEEDKDLLDLSGLSFKEAWRHKLVTLYSVTVVVILFLIHPIVSKAVFQLFSCQSFEDGSSYLVEDMRVDCKSKEYQLFRDTYGIPIALVFCVGLLVVALVVLIRVRGKLNHPTVMARLQFVFDGYAGKRYFWEVVIMTRKLCVVALVVIFRNEPLTQLYLGLWLVMGALIMHLYARPFEKALATNLEGISLLTTAVTLLTGMMFFSKEMEPGAIIVVSVFLVILNSLVCILFAVYISYEFVQLARKAAAVQEMEEQLVKQYAEMKAKEEERKRRKEILDNVTNNRKSVGIGLNGLSMDAEVRKQQRQEVEESMRESRAKAIEKLHEASSTRSERSGKLGEETTGREDGGGEEWEDGEEMAEEEDEVRGVARFTSITGVLEDESLRRVFLTYVEQELAGNAAYPESYLPFLKESEEWRAGFERMEEEERHEAANRFAAKFLDDDEELFLEDLEYGTVTQLTYACNDGVLSATMWDGAVGELFGPLLDLFKTEYDGREEALEELLEEGE